MTENDTLLTESQPVEPIQRIDAPHEAELADLIQYVPLPPDYYELSARMRVETLRATLDSLAIAVEALATVVLRRQMATGNIDAASAAKTETPVENGA